MPSFRAVDQVVASTVRPTSATAFAAEVLAVAATSGDLDWATWRRLNLGWRFWMGLGSWGAVLAFACLFACLIMVISRHECGEENLKDTSWCVWLNVATFALSILVPAIAAI